MTRRDEAVRAAVAEAMHLPLGYVGVHPQGRPTFRRGADGAPVYGPNGEWITDPGPRRCEVCFAVPLGLYPTERITAVADVLHGYFARWAVFEYTGGRDAHALAFLSPDQ